MFTLSYRLPPLIDQPPTLLRKLNAMRSVYLVPDIIPAIIMDSGLLLIALTGITLAHSNKQNILFQTDRYLLLFTLLLRKSPARNFSCGRSVSNDD
jgi:hypothetical protein